MTRTPQATTSQRTELMTLADDAGTVTVNKLLSKGERLEIVADGETIKLDSLLLESFSWQRDAEGLSSILDDGDAVTGDPVTRFELETTDGAEAATIASEYSSVGVSAVEDDTGLRVLSPDRGAGTVLGTKTLRELATIDDTYVFSEWFRTPFGPEDTETEGAI